MTIDLVNILVKNCPLRILEMAFQWIKISNFSGGVCPQVSSRGFTLRQSPETFGYKNILILHTYTQKVGHYDNT